MFKKDERGIIAVKDIKDTNSQYPSRIIPEGELKCIWMTAGQIAYKLCNYEYNCEFCPFNEAFRNKDELSRLGDEIPDCDRNLLKIDFLQEMIKTGKWTDNKGIDERKLFKALFLFNIRTDLYYSKNHSWANPDNEKSVKIGVDSFISKFLTRIKDIILPLEGKILFQGKPCCWIIDEYGTLPVISPISGTAEAVNGTLSSNFSQVLNAPYESGWLMRLNPFNLAEEKKKLIADKGIIDLFFDHAQKIREILLVEMEHKRRHGKNGAVLGEEVSILEKLLTPEAIFENFLLLYKEIDSLPSERNDIYHINTV